MGASGRPLKGERDAAMAPGAGADMRHVAGEGMIKRRLKHWKSMTGYDKSMAYIHIHGIAHHHHNSVIVAGRIHHPKRDRKR
jgi:hypothetical protein